VRVESYGTRKVTETPAGEIDPETRETRTPTRTPTTKGPTTKEEQAKEVRTERKARRARNLQASSSTTLAETDSGTESVLETRKTDGTGFSVMSSVFLTKFLKIVQ